MSRAQKSDFDLAGVTTALRFWSSVLPFQQFGVTSCGKVRLLGQLAAFYSYYRLSIYYVSSVNLLVPSTTLPRLLPSVLQTVWHSRFPTLLLSRSIWQ
jgi:hypothetical protein